MSEKETESSYSLLPSDRSATSSDDLYYDGQPPSFAIRKTSRRSILTYSVGGIALLVAYSALLITVTSVWWKKDRLHGANVVDCKSNRCNAMTSYPDD